VEGVSRAGFTAMFVGDRWDGCWRKTCKTHAKGDEHSPKGAIPQSVVRYQVFTLHLYYNYVLLAEDGHQLAYLAVDCCYISDIRHCVVPVVQVGRTYTE
jgi:hypothetical protein